MLSEKEDVDVADTMATTIERFADPEVKKKAVNINTTTKTQTRARKHTHRDHTIIMVTRYKDIHSGGRCRSSSQYDKSTPPHPHTHTHLDIYFPTHPHTHIHTNASVAQKNKRK